MSLESLGHIAIVGGPVYLAGNLYQVNGLNADPVLRQEDNRKRFVCGTPIIGYPLYLS
jgi:hypothetical protein